MNFWRFLFQTSAGEEIPSSAWFKWLSGLCLLTSQDGVFTTSRIVIWGQW